MNKPERNISTDNVKQEEAVKKGCVTCLPGCNLCRIPREAIEVVKLDLGNIEDEKFIDLQKALEALPDGFIHNHYFVDQKLLLSGNKNGSSITGFVIENAEQYIQDADINKAIELPVTLKGKAAIKETLKERIVVLDTVQQPDPDWLTIQTDVNTYDGAMPVAEEPVVYGYESPRRESTNTVAAPAISEQTITVSQPETVIQTQTIAPIDVPTVTVSPLPPRTQEIPQIVTEQIAEVVAPVAVEPEQIQVTTQILESSQEPTSAVKETKKIQIIAEELTQRGIQDQQPFQEPIPITKAQQIPTIQTENTSSLDVLDLNSVEILNQVQDDGLETNSNEIRSEIPQQIVVNKSATEITVSSPLDEIIIFESDAEISPDIQTEQTKETTEVIEIPVASVQEIQGLLLYVSKQKDHQHIVPKISIEYSGKGTNIKIAKDLFSEFSLLVEQYKRLNKKIITKLAEEEPELIFDTTTEEEIGENTNRMGIPVQNSYASLMNTLALYIFGCLHCVLYQGRKTKQEYIIYHYQQHINFSYSQKEML